MQASLLNLNGSQLIPLSSPSNVLKSFTSKTARLNTCTPKPSLSVGNKSDKKILSVKSNLNQENSNALKLIKDLGAASLASMLAAMILFPSSDALAYIGGGPYGREVTRGQDLTGRDFSGLDLTQQDFKTSILRQANFSGSKLLGASFFDADLTGADFTDSDLRGADFSLTSAVKANFTNANFEGASVTGNTSFKGSTIYGADFTDVYFRDDQKKYLCAVADGVNKFTGNETRETLLCD